MEYNFECIKCQYKCKFISHWNEHLKSKKHTGEKRKVRCDKELCDKCELCDYKSTKTTNMKLHYLNKHAIKEERQKIFPFYCDKCDFGVFVELLYNRHLETLKHKTKSNNNIIF